MQNPLNALPEDIRSLIRVAVLPITGSTRDWASGISTSQVGGLRWARSFRDKAAIYPNSTGYIEAAAAPSISGFTGFVFGNTVQVASTQECTRAIFNSRRWYVGSAGNVTLFDGTTFSWTGSGIAGNGQRSIGTTVGPTTGPPLTYIDGSYADDGHQDVSFAVPSDTWWLCGTGSYGLRFPFSGILFGDGPMSASQMSTLHDWSQSLRSSHWRWARPTWPSRVQRNEPGVVGAWDFGAARNDIVEDRSVNANDVTLVGGVELVNSPAGRACRFDGIGGHGELPNGLPDFSDSTFTICASFIAQNVTTTASIIAHEARYVNGWDLLLQGGFLIVQFRRPGITRFQARASRVFSTGMLYNVCAVVTTSTTDASKNNVVFYINGELSPTVVIVQDEPYVHPAGQPASIGIGSNLFNWHEFDGVIGAIMLKDYGIDAAEAAANYAALSSIPTYRDNFDFCPVTLAAVGGAIGAEVSRSGWQCADTVGRWDVVDEVAAPRGRVISCSVGGKLRLPLQGAGNFATKVFDYTGTASIAKLAHSLEITASAGATIRQVELTVA